MLVSAIQQCESAVSTHISPTPLGHHREPGWAPCVIKQLPTIYFTHDNCINATLSVHPTLSFPYCAHKSILYISVLIPALHIGSSVPFFCCCCCSVTQLCPTLCDPMDGSTPGFPVLHHLLEFVQTHAHWVGDAIQPSHPVLPFSSCLQYFPASGSFLMSWLFTSGGQSIGASASAPVFPKNIQGWFPLRWTGLISLQSKGFSRVFSSTILLDSIYMRKLPEFL